MCDHSSRPDELDKALTLSPLAGSGRILELVLRLLLLSCPHVLLITLVQTCRARNTFHACMYC